MDDRGDTVEAEGRIARRAREDDHIRVTLLAEEGGEVVGTYRLAYAHADFWRLSGTLSAAAQRRWTVRLTVDPDSHLIRSVVFGRYLNFMNRQG
jgi:hypothetical protein